MSSRDQALPVIGTEITVNGKEYIIEESIGLGTSANVICATEVNTQQRVAMKIFKRHVRMNRATQEIKAMRKCDCPLVLKLLDFDMHTRIGEETFKVTISPYYPSGDLYNIVEKGGKFAEEDAKPLILQVIRGLQHVHERGLAHRDVKLENIFIDQNCNLVLGDFGFAREEENLRTELGTAGYMAPEIVGSGFYTKKVDIFAVGVIYFILLAGFPPFMKCDQEDWWYNKMMYGRWDRFWQAHCRTHKFSEEQKQIIQLMMQRYPRKRPSAIELLQHDYFRELTKSKSEVQDNIRARLQKQ